MLHKNQTETRGEKIKNTNPCFQSITKQDSFGEKKCCRRDKKEMGVPHSAHMSNVSTILKLLEGNSAFLQ
jgi:hypothetical protein